jgi:hypothetical protein
MEDSSLKHGRAIGQLWKIYRSNMEEPSLNYGRSIVETWKVLSVFSIVRLSLCSQLLKPRNYAYYIFVQDAEQTTGNCPCGVYLGCNEEEYDGISA